MINHKNKSHSKHLPGSECSSVSSASEKNQNSIKVVCCFSLE